jgi:hypothetical protein
MGVMQTGLGHAASLAFICPPKFEKVGLMAAEGSFKREALPHDLSGYEREALRMTMPEFEKARPFPFLLYARSNLWDPTLVLSRNAQDAGEQTRLVDYNVGSGGMTFLSPIRKVQSDPRVAGILLGRSTVGNDVVVPVSSISTKHARFLPPGMGNPMAWQIVDLDSRNGTYLGEEQLKPQKAVSLDDGVYLRLGGNLIAWFLYPGRLWQLLHNKNELKKLTDL